MSNLVCVIQMGDSLSASENCYPFNPLGLNLTAKGDSTTALKQSGAVYLTSQNYVFWNMAVAGTRLADDTDNMISVATSYVDPALVNRAVAPTSGTGGAARPTRKHVLSFLPGSNDGCLGYGGGHDVAEFVAEVVAFCAARKAAGFDAVILGTVLPRDEGVGSPMSDANRLAYNAIIRAAGWATAHGIDGIYDICSNAILNDIASCSNATYWTGDKIHPTTAGHALAAPIWKATLDAVIATL